MRVIAVLLAFLSAVGAVDGPIRLPARALRAGQSTAGTAVDTLSARARAGSKPFWMDEACEGKKVGEGSKIGDECEFYSYTSASATEKVLVKGTCMYNLNNFVKCHTGSAADVGGVLGPGGKPLKFN
jgi:hypothetical protein